MGYPLYSGTAECRLPIGLGRNDNPFFERLFAMFEILAIAGLALLVAAQVSVRVMLDRSDLPHVSFID